MNPSHWIWFLVFSLWCFSLKNKQINKQTKKKEPAVLQPPCCSSRQHGNCLTNALNECISFSSYQFVSRVSLVSVHVVVVPIISIRHTRRHTRRWRKVWLHDKLFDSRHQASLSVTTFVLFFFFFFYKFFWWIWNDRVMNTWIYNGVLSKRMQYQKNAWLTCTWDSTSWNIKPLNLASECYD